MPAPAIKDSRNVSSRQSADRRSSRGRRAGSERRSPPGSPRTSSSCHTPNGPLQPVAPVAGARRKTSTPGHHGRAHAAPPAGTARQIELGQPRPHGPRPSAERARLPCGAAGRRSPERTGLRAGRGALEHRDPHARDLGADGTALRRPSPRRVPSRALHLPRRAMCWPRSRTPRTRPKLSWSSRSQPFHACSRRTAGPAPTRVASSGTSSCREGWNSGSDACPR